MDMTYETGWKTGTYVSEDRVEIFAIPANIRTPQREPQPPMLADQATSAANTKKVNSKCLSDLALIR